MNVNVTVSREELFAEDQNPSSADNIHRQVSNETSSLLALRRLNIHSAMLFEGENNKNKEKSAKSSMNKNPRCLGLHREAWQFANGI